MSDADAPASGGGTVCAALRAATQVAAQCPVAFRGPPSGRVEGWAAGGARGRRAGLPVDRGGTMGGDAEAGAGAVMGTGVWEAMG